MIGKRDFDTASRLIPDKIRANWPKTKILLISGYPQEATARLLLNKGVEFLCKPIDCTELIVRVNHLAPKVH